MISKADNDLFIDVKLGSKPAFETLFLKYYEKLCLYAHSILRDKYSSEEIVQEVFVKVWENRSQLFIDISVKSYLYRTVHNHCLNYVQHLNVRQRFQNSRIVDPNSLALIAPLSNHYPIANLLLQELEAKIDQSINALPEQCRQVFMLCRYEELSYAETAQKLGISINTVKTQLQRAVSRLRDELKEFLPLLFFLFYNVS